jgi:hypothetical protein
MAREHAVGRRFGDFGEAASRPWRHCRRAEGFFLLPDCFPEEGRFHRRDAAESPARGCHFLDQLGFELVGGFEAVEECCFELVVVCLRFVREDDLRR